MAERTCISCKRSITNDTKATYFGCPNCNKQEIVRCSKCRKLGVPYQCKCGFEGP